MIKGEYIRSIIQILQRKATFYSILFFIILGCIFTLWFSSPMKYLVDPTEKPYHILVVFSYVKKCEWTQEQYKGVINCLKDHDINAKVDSFHLNADLLLSKQETEVLDQMLKQYESNPPDLIIVCDDQATYSLQATEHPLTYKVPIVFCGVDYVNYDIMKSRTNITGFTTQPDYLKCYELAKQLFGNITWLHVITEPGYLGHLVTADMRNQLSVLPNLTEVIETKNMDYKLDLNYDTLFVHQNELENQLKIRILKLDIMPGRMMKWLLRNQPGVIYLMPRWSSLFSGIARMNNVPFLMVNNEGFGDGRLGGYMISNYDQTYQATETGIRILQGTVPDTIPVQHSKLTPTFDWRQLENWKISQDKLPPGSVIVNMPFTVKHRTALWIGAISFSFFILIILLVLNQLYKKEKWYKKRILHTLIKEQYELNITMDSISDGVVTLDNQQKIATINQAALNWLELDNNNKDCIGKPLISLFNIQLASNPNYLNNLLDKAYLTNSSYPLDTSAYLVTKGGLSFPISGSIAPIHTEGIWQGSIIVFRNIISEIAQKEFLDLCITAGDVFVWKYNQTKQLFIYDNTFFHFLQWPENETGELTISSFLSFLHPDDRSRWDKAIQIISTGRQCYYNVQLRLQTGNNTYSWWEYRIMPESNQLQSKHESFFGLCLNIDYLKKKEKELEKIRDIALEADQQKTIFLANMSHEIRTPLNAIVGFSELLIESDDLTVGDKQEFITIINENCRLLLNLVNDILDISRIESGITFKQEPFELNALILEISEENRKIAEEGVQIRTELPEMSYTIWSDNFRIRQILNNLLNNALKFTTEGNVTTGYQLDKENGLICIFVKDTGRGIPYEEQTKIFERFYKSDNFTQGGGLGLSICNEIVRRMNGSITLESEPGKGTSFYVTLPDGTDKISRKETEL